MKSVRISDSVAYHVYRSARLMRRHFMQMGSDEGLSLTQEQWFVLNKLVTEDGRSQSDLCEEIFADRPNLTRILQSMERRGLVKRLADAEDGRKVRVFLTSAGRRDHDAFSELVPRERRKLFRGISKKDLETAKRVLAQIESNLTDES